MTLQEFRSRFGYRFLDELPGGDSGPAVRRFPTDFATGESTGVLFEPAGSPAWIGLFRAGTLARRAHTGLHGHPDAERLCVVSKGDAYVVHSGGEECSTVATMVMQVWPCVDLGLLVLVTPWEAIALGTGGERWRTGRIGLDGLEIRERIGSRLRLKVTGLEEESEIEIDLSTGKPVS